MSRSLGENLFVLTFLLQFDIKVCTFSKHFPFSCYVSLGDDQDKISSRNKYLSHIAVCLIIVY